MKQKRFNTCCGIVCILGLLLVIGTAGASDMGNISLIQTVWQSTIGLALFAGGGRLGGFML